MAVEPQVMQPVSHWFKHFHTHADTLSRIADDPGGVSVRKHYAGILFSTPASDRRNLYVRWLLRPHEGLLGVLVLNVVLCREHRGVLNRLRTEDILAEPLGFTHMRDFLEFMAVKSLRMLREDQAARDRAQRLALDKIKARRGRRGR